jgi:hypothetical protein
VDLLIQPNRLDQITLRSTHQRDPFAAEGNAEVGVWLGGNAANVIQDIGDMITQFNRKP